MAKDPRRSFDTGLMTVDRRASRVRGALEPGGSMRRSTVVRAVGLGLVASLLLPAAAMADTFDAAGAGSLADSVGINSLWVIVAGCLVMFMQAGFAPLGSGLSPGQNGGEGGGEGPTQLS